MLHDRYIVWRLVRKAPPERNDKIPLDYRTGHKADPYDPQVWLAQDAARMAAGLLGPDHGVGYVFMPGAGEFFIDIDDCLKDGEWSPIAMELCGRFPGAFVEVSSSGTGLHIIGRAVAPPGDRMCKSKAGFDLYTERRFVALSFDRVQGDPSTDHTAAVATLVDQYLRLEEGAGVRSDWIDAPVDGYGPERPDDEIIAAARRSTSMGAAFGGRASFEDLWTCNVPALADAFPDGGGRPYDCSSADYSLAMRLMWWCGGNCEQVHRLMWRSGLVRPKWEDHSNYLDSFTITRARGQWLAGGGKHYTAGRGVAVGSVPAADQRLVDGSGSLLGAGWDYLVPGFDFNDCKTNGRPKGVYPNWLKLTAKAGVTLKYNDMTREPEIIIPGATYLIEHRYKGGRTTLLSLCNQVEFPVSHVDDFIDQEARENAYHPARDWIMSRPWDGVDRIDLLIATLDASDPGIADMLVRRWLHTCVDALVMPDGIAAGGMLVLQGAQYRGKTTWLRQLMGEFGKSEAALDVTDKDSIAQNTGYWIVELAELDGFTSKQETNAIKAFITRQIDEFRAPYERKPAKHRRRTVFCGSVNPGAFLVDETGNRRFWVIACGDNLNAMHGLDVQQLWAQVLAQRVGPVKPWNRDELARLNASNEQFEVERHEPIYDLMFTTFAMDQAPCMEMTLTDILRHLGLPADGRGQRGASKQVAAALGVTGSTRTNRRRVFMVPPLKAFNTPSF